MKTLQKVLVGALAATMLIVAAPFVSAEKLTFTDVASDHWAQQNINYLVEKDVLNGYKQDNGTYIFKPEADVSRAEFIKMLDETFGLVDMANIKGKYKDVAESDWFYSYFAKAVAQGYIHSYTNGSGVNPDGDLSREEATSLLVRYLNLSDDKKAATNVFTDYTQISAAYNQDVLKAVAAGVINGYEESDGTYTFRPKATLTRAEALTILYRAAGAIFTTDLNGADENAFESNAVVKKAGITLTNQSLDGRVIISEGADNGTVTIKNSTINDTLFVRGGATISLDDTTITNLVVDSPDVVTIALKNGTTVKNLVINKRCSFVLNNGTTISDLTVAKGAEYVTFTGKGTIENATINAKGFKSSVVPFEFEIADGLTASFATETYQGSSQAQDAFLFTPYISKTESVHCINVLSAMDGVVHYYYTNSNYCPSVSEFDSYYSASGYADNFEIDADRAKCAYTYKISEVGSFGYVVLQLESKGRYYPPVVIPNKVSTGTGFSTTPALSGNTVTFTATSGGTVYYMYAEEGAKPEINEFFMAYEDQQKELKGALEKRTGSITVNETYAKINNYMIFLFQASNGLYYEPVVVSLGDTGFSIAPVVATPGTIEFTPSESGTLYYYYSTSDDLPAPDQFNSVWRKATYGDSISVTKSKSSTLAYKSTYTDQYPYLILCLRPNNSDYLTPVALRVDYHTGFESLPEVVSDTLIRYKTEVSGTLKFYYTTTYSAPSPAGFNTNYTKQTSAYKGSVKVVANSYDQMSYSAEVAEEKKYMVLMLDDGTDKGYQPVVIKLLTSENTGFTLAPYIYDGEIYFKTESNSQVYYYYARTNDAVPMSEFLVRWAQADHSDVITATAGASCHITLNKSLLSGYPYIVFAVSAGGQSDITTYPVILDAASDAENTVSTALKVTNFTKTSITLTSYASGTVFYYETNDKTAPSQAAFDSEYSKAEKRGYGMVNPTESITLNLSGNYTHVVFRLENMSTNTEYTAMIVNTASASNVSGPTTGNTAQTNGFTLKSVDPDTRTVTVIPAVSGILTVKISADQNGTTSLGGTQYVVVKDQEFEFTYSNAFEQLGFYLIIQMTDSDGKVYKAYSGISLAQ